MSISVDGTNGVTYPDLSVQNTAATGFGFKNRIINGACVIDQRNAGASVTQGTSVIYTADRWWIYGAAASKFTLQQQTSVVPAGYTHALKATSSSTYTVASTDEFDIAQYIEGFNVADLGWGTANATAVTLSFRVYSSLTGTFGGQIANSDSSRSYPFSYTISAANTWETKTITIAGDTSGTWLTTNGAGMLVLFSLGAGSTKSGTANAWQAGNYTQPTGSVSVVGTSGATFYITGVQLEKGSTATSFDYRPYGTELLLAQRYYFKLTSFVTAGVLGVGITSGATSSWVNIISPVAFRASPTVSYSALAISDQASYNCIVSSIAATAQTLTGGGVAFNHAGGATLYRTAIVNTTSTSGYIDFSAEL